MRKGATGCGDSIESRISKSKSPRNSLKDPDMAVAVANFIEAMRRFQKCGEHSNKVMNPTQTDNVVEQRSVQRCVANHIFPPRNVRKCARTAQTSPSRTRVKRRNGETHASANSILPHEFEGIPTYINLVTWRAAIALADYAAVNISQCWP
jgi:hypothetical protein